MIQKIKQLCLSGFFKDFSVILFFDLCTKVVSMIILFLEIRLLPQNEYGIFVKFNSLSNLLFGIFASGIGVALVRFISEFNSRRYFSIIPHMYSLSIIAIAVLLLPIFLATFLLSKIYHVQNLVIILCLTYTLFRSFLRINQFFYQGQEKYTKSGLIDLGRVVFILTPLLIFYCFFKEFNLWFVCSSYCVVAILLYILSSMPLCTKRVFSRDLKSILYGKKLIMESGWLLLYYLLLAIFSQADVLLLSRFASDSEVANYGVAQKYQVLVLSILPSLLALLRVRTAKNEYVQSSQKRKDFTVKWIRTIAPATLVLIVAGAILSKYLFPLINGEQYAKAVPLFQIMLVGVGISYIFSPIVPVIMAAKRFPLLCSLCTGALLITVIGNYIFIPRFGAISPSVFFVVSNAFLNIGATVFILLEPQKAQQK